MATEPIISVSGRISLMASTSAFISWTPASALFQVKVSSSTCVSL